MTIWKNNKPSDSKPADETISSDKIVGSEASSEASNESSNKSKPKEQKS